MKKRFLILIGVCLLLVACSSGEDQPRLQVDRQYPGVGISEIFVEMDAGHLVLLPASSTGLSLSASFGSDTLLVEDQQGDRLNLLISDSEKDDEVVIYLPDGIAVKVDVFSADVRLDSLDGRVEIFSVAGNIALDAFAGEARLWAGRGNIDVHNGRGDLVAIGEHGVLSVSGFAGNLSVSTIMGEIHFVATGGSNAVVSLESDHGPIEAIVPADAGMTIQVTTTSGYVTCLGANLSQEVSGCTGVAGEGTGELRIRTVSGRVELFVISESVEGSNE